MKTNDYIAEIQNNKVIAIYELDRLMGAIEILYLKDGVEKSLSIQTKCHFGPMYDGCWFEFGDIPLPDIHSGKKKKLSSRFSDIDMIESMNFYTTPTGNGAYCDLEIIYSNKLGEIHTYLFHSTSDEEDIHQIILFKDQKSTYRLETGNYDDIYDFVGISV
ncbi:MAG: hypothetical protein WCW84_11980 [Sulfurimonas sp.]